MAQVYFRVEDLGAEFHYVSKAYLTEVWTNLTRRLWVGPGEKWRGFATQCSGDAYKWTSDQGLSWAGTCVPPAKAGVNRQRDPLVLASPVRPLVSVINFRRRRERWCQDGPAAVTSWTQLSLVVHWRVGDGGGRGRARSRLGPHHPWALTQSDAQRTVVEGGGGRNGSGSGWVVWTRSVGSTLPVR